MKRVTPRSAALHVLTREISLLGAKGALGVQGATENGQGDWDFFVAGKSA